MNTHDNTQKGYLRVHYLLNKLKEAPLYVVPTDTDSVWEYYLLENLSCGLMRDDQFASIGYIGCLAESWEQVNPYTWQFTLRTNLKLSNGQELSAQSIFDYYSDFLKNGKSRHLKLLRNVKNIKLVGQVMELNFSVVTDRVVLHELSLADAVYVDPNQNALEPWKVTVGPYAIDYAKTTNSNLRLVANPNSQLYQKGMPTVVDMFQLQKIEDQQKLFTEDQPVDFMLLATQSNRDTMNRLKLNGAIHEVFAKTNVVYFYFPNESIATRDGALRKSFSDAVQAAKNRASWIADNSVSAWDQMIPPGFSGFCDNPPQTKSEIRQITPQKEILIWLRIPIANLSKDFLEVFEAEIRSRKIADKITYTEAKPNGKYFAALMGFLGNQQDPMGSWSYLIASENAPLGAFANEYKIYFQKLEDSTSTKIDRVQISSEIQCKVLSEAHAVPVIVGSFHSLRSERVDVSRLNRFDNRVRLYEMRMRDCAAHA